MKKSIRLMGAIAAVAIMALLAPVSAQAGCDSKVVVFSGVKGAPRKVNSNAVICIADPSQEYGDNAIINPGSNEISLRYIDDLGPDVTSITATLDGLGFSERSVTLNRVPVSTDPTGATFYYNSAPIDLDPSQVGCITADVILDAETTDRGSFHTVGSSC